MSNWYFIVARYEPQEHFGSQGISYIAIAAFPSKEQAVAYAEQQTDTTRPVQVFSASSDVEAESTARSEWQW